MKVTLDYLRYMLSPVILAITAYGLSLGGNWVLLGLGVLLGVLFLDCFLPEDHGIRDLRYPWLYDAIISLGVFGGIAMMLAYAYWVGSGHFATMAVQVEAFVTMMLVQFIVSAPCLHDFFHRENMFLRQLGRLGMVMLFDPWREITHVVTHHIHVGTPHDPDYGRRGDTVYGHIYRTFKGQIKEAYHLEKMMWTKRERKWYDPRNAWVPRAVLLVAWSAILFAFGGLAGMLTSIAVCLLGPRMLLEVFNYTQHYGLVSATPARFEGHHTWNHITPFVRILALEITNHRGHHEDSYKPFYGLVPDATGPKQPQFLMCFFMALVPPLWFAMIKPRLYHWDRYYASPQERELAYAENARAGWHELNDELLPREIGHYAGLPVPA